MWKKISAWFAGSSAPEAPAPAPPEELLPAPGWDALHDALAAVYPEQIPYEWAHRGVHAMHDLRPVPENPLEVVRIYAAPDHWHYVGFGLSELFETEPTDQEWSGAGYEWTFRLARPEGSPDAPLWPVDVLVSMAKAVYGGHRFEAGHTVKTGPIDGRPDNPLTAFLIAEDPQLGTIHTPRGKVQLLQLVGVPGALRERGLAEGVDTVLDELRAVHPLLVTPTQATPEP